MTASRISRLTVAVLISACSSGTDVAPAPDAAIGEYTLRTINGNALPAINGSSRVLSGTTLLNADGSFGQVYAQVSATTGGQYNQVASSGTWRRLDAGTIELRNTLIAVATWSVTVKTDSLESNGWIWVRAP